MKTFYIEESYANFLRKKVAALQWIILENDVTKLKSNITYYSFQLTDEQITESRFENRDGAFHIRILLSFDLDIRLFQVSNKIVSRQHFNLGLKYITMKTTNVKKLNTYGNLDDTTPLVEYTLVDSNKPIGLNGYYKSVIGIFYDAGNKCYRIQEKSGGVVNTNILEDLDDPFIDVNSPHIALEYLQGILLNNLQNTYLL